MMSSLKRRPGKKRCASKLTEVNKRNALPMEARFFCPNIFQKSVAFYQSSVKVIATAVFVHERLQARSDALYPGRETRNNVTPSQEDKVPC